jgi:hypothetical protein
LNFLPDSSGALYLYLLYLASTPQKTKGREAQEMGMNKRSLVVLTLAALFFAASSKLHGQALPTASAAGILQVGGGVSNANGDEFTNRLTGLTGYATFDFRRHIGAEVDVHVLTLVAPFNFVENTYLGGGRYFWNKGRFTPYVKVLGGLGQAYIKQPSATYVQGAPSTTAAIAGGAGLDIRLPHHINVRAIDYEYQVWPGYGSQGLSPSMITCGAAYRFH